MSKYLALISLGVGLTLLGFRGFLFREPPGFSRFKMDPAELARTSAFLDSQFRARASFVEYKERIYEDLARGELTLIMGCDHLFQFAREHYPKYLRNLAWRSKKTLKEEMAKNLIDDFRFQAEKNPSLMKVVHRLDRAMAAKPFREWLGQPWLRVFDSEKTCPPGLRSP